MHENQKISGLNFLKIIALSIIIFGHLIEHYLLKYFDIQLYIAIQTHHAMMYGLMCELLFMISGFLFYYSASKNQSLLDFVVKKWIRLGPVVVFVALLWCFFPNLGVFCHYSSALLQCLFIAQNGIIGTSDMSHLWYVDIMLLCMIFYFYLLKNFNFKTVKLIMALIIFFSYTMIIPNEKYYPDDPYFNGIFFSFLLRGLASVGVGFFLGYLHNTCSLSLKLTGIPYILYSLFEVFMFIILIASTLIMEYKLPSYIYIYIFIMLIILFIADNGFFTQLINHKANMVLAKYTYSTYVTHIATFNFLLHYVWKNSIVGIDEHPLFNLLFALILPYIIGALVFYFIEQPSQKVLGAKYAKFRQQQKNWEVPEHAPSAPEQEVSKLLP